MVTVFPEQMRHGIWVLVAGYIHRCWTRIKVFSHPCQTLIGLYAIFSKEETRFGGSYSSVTIQQMDYVFRCEGPTLNLSTSQSCGFLMKLFNSANIDTITNCRWYLDFQLPSEVLVKKVPNSRGNLRTVKIYTVTLVYRSKLCYI